MSKRSMPEHTPAEDSSNAGSTPTITATTSTQLEDSQTGTGFNVNGENFEFIREQDRLLPIANVARIMKQAIPVNAKIAKDAKETVQECVSELISFVTSEATERCQQEKRKTINGDDIIWAFETLGFEQYAHLMKIYLQRYKDVTKMDKGSLTYEEPMVNQEMMGYAGNPESNADDPVYNPNA